MINSYTLCNHTSHNFIPINIILKMYTLHSHAHYRRYDCHYFALFHSHSPQRTHTHTLIRLVFGNVYNIYRSKFDADSNSLILRGSHIWPCTLPMYITIQYMSVCERMRALAITPPPLLIRFQFGKTLIMLKNPHFMLSKRVLKVHKKHLT